MSPPADPRKAAKLLEERRSLTKKELDFLGGLPPIVQLATLDDRHKRKS